MIKARHEHIEIIAQMLKEMFTEVNNTASKDIEKYKKLAKKHLKNDEIWIDKDNRGFFIMRDETVDVIPEKMWNGVSVYIKPEYRKGRVLKKFYDFMFDNYDGVIMGFTDVNSEHNKTLLKRHKLLGYVYKMERK